jgi:photosystem II stability/assembly factor-like uncharacterized protein
MKKITTLLFILITISFYAQWNIQASGIKESLFDIHCITEDFVVAVGQDGKILKTTDGGLNWVQKNSGTTAYLDKVEFGSPNVGYIVGGAKLLKTIDAGESWSSISVEGSNYFNGLSCLNENTFFVGVNCILKKTTDGGISFETLFNSTQGCIRDIQFINESVGYFTDDFDLYKTTDGGSTWNVIHNYVFSFFFLNEAVGFINAGDGLSKTIDGGENNIFLETISFRMDKIVATGENIVWGIPKQFYLNDPPHRIMRGEIISFNEFQMTLNNNPLFTSINFANSTKGYGVEGRNIYKNSTGNLLDVSELNTTENIKIYPNPSSSQINISFNQESAKPFLVEIVDSLGKKVYVKSYATQNNIVISTTSFSKGIYFITIESQEKKQTQKLVIN